MHKRVIKLSIVIIIIGLPIVFYPQIQHFLKYFVLFPKIDSVTRTEITYLLNTADQLNQSAEILFKKSIAEIWREQLRGARIRGVYPEVLAKTSYTYRDTASRLNHEAYLIARRTNANSREMKIVFELAGWPMQLDLPEQYYYYQGCLATLGCISVGVGPDALAKVIAIRRKYSLSKWPPPLNWGIGYYTFQGKLYTGGEEYKIVATILKGADSSSLALAPEPEYPENKYAKPKLKPSKKLKRKGSKKK